MSHDRIGDVLEAQGNLPEALKSFREGLAIAERLASADPGNADWQRGLAVSHAHLADVYRRSNDPDNALAALRQGQAVMKRVVKLSPDNAGWKNDLGWFDEQIAALNEIIDPRMWKRAGRAATRGAAVLDDLIGRGLCRPDLPDRCPQPMPVRDHIRMQNAQRPASGRPVAR